MDGRLRLLDGVALENGGIIMNNQVLSVEKWIEYYQKTLESGIETADTLRQKYEDYKLREEQWKKSRDYISYLNAQRALENVLGIGKYTIDELTKINQVFCGSHGPLTDSDLDMANSYVRLIESTRSKEPKAGDIIRYTDKYGTYYSKAHIEKVEDDIVNICAEPYISFIHEENDGISCATSGGLWSNLPVEKLKYQGAGPKVFQDWGHCGACAHGTIQFEADVSIWEYDEHETSYTTKTHNHIFIWKNRNEDKDYLYASGTRVWRNKLELQAWLITVHGEVFQNCDDMIEVWYWRQKEASVSPKEYEALNLPEDTFWCNGLRRCKRLYDEKNTTVITYFVWYWDDPEIEDISKRCEKQNKVIEQYRSRDGIENSLAIWKIKTDVIKPVEIDI